jgi:hypothetical protein
MALSFLDLTGLANTGATDYFWLKIAAAINLIIACLVGVSKDKKKSSSKQQQ